MKKTRWLFITLAVILIASLALVSCKPAETPVEEEAPVEEAPVEEAPAEEAAPTEAPAVEAPTEAPVVEEDSKIGGNLVMAFNEEPDTLDIYKSAFSIASAVTDFIGGALVTKNVDGKHIPYLATSWDVSADGLEWTFHLREDIKFQDGDPLTANDFV